MNDIPKVGGKNASLGEMYRNLSSKGVAVPDGFALTADAYWAFLDHNDFRAPLKDLIPVEVNKRFWGVGYGLVAPKCP